MSGSRGGTWWSVLWCIRTSRSATGGPGASRALKMLFPELFHIYFFSKLWSSSGTKNPIWPILEGGEGASSILEVLEY